MPGEVDSTLLTEIERRSIVRRHKHCIGEARAHQPRAILLVVSIESKDTSTPFPLDPTIATLEMLLLRVLIPMVANVVRLVRAIVGVVHEIGFSAPVVPRPDGFLRWVAVEEIVILFRQCTVSAFVQNT